MPVLSDCFELTRVINLRERTDRLRDVTRELRAIGMDFARGSVELYAAERPSELAGFRSLGAHGCFLSHLDVLRDAQQRGVKSLLVLEDDCHIPPRSHKAIVDAALSLADRRWGFAYFGHVVPLEAGQSSGMIPYDGPLQTTHCYAIHTSALSAVVDYLEACLTRPPGDPIGGPMDVDGAYTMFRTAHPEVQTWIAQPVLALQRSSRSDVTPNKVDTIPLIGSAVSFARRIKRIVAPVR